MKIDNFTSSSKKTPNMKTILVTMQDRRQYDFVDTKCGRIAVHWFTSYCPLIIFLQAIILIVVDNIWLKLPWTSSTIDHFITLVFECHSSTGTCLAVSNVLWDTNVSENNRGNEGTENRNNDIEGKATDSHQPTKNRSVSSPVSLDVSEAIKAKALHEKVDQFRINVENKKNIVITYFYQSIAQAILSSLFLVMNIVFLVLSKEEVNCKIKDFIMSGDYSDFKCANGVVPYFQISYGLSCVLFFTYLTVCICISRWSYDKKDKQFEFKKSLDPLITEQGVETINQQDSNLLKLLTDIKPAEGNLAFMLYLLNEYYKLYTLRFSVFLAKKTEKTINDYILTSEWPIEKLRNVSSKDERSGRILRLADLPGIPKAVFQMEDLDSLTLENCNVQDYLEHGKWQNLKLLSLSLVKCGLTEIPAVILNMGSLEILDLSNNKIKSIPQNIKERLPSLRNLKLRGNETLKIVLEQAEQLKCLMRLEIDEAQQNKLDAETNDLLKEVIVTEVSTVEDVDVIKYSPSEAPTRIKNMPGNSRETVYKMTSKPKGGALIINIFYPNQRPKRISFMADVEKLKKLLIGIGYEVKVLPNRSDWTLSNLKTELSALIEKNKLCDSFILLLMCFSQKDELLLNDGVIKVKEIASDAS